MSLDYHKDFITWSNNTDDTSKYDTIYYTYDTFTNKINQIYLELENIQEPDENELDPLNYLKYGFYINLKERVDRKENLLSNFKSLDIPTLQMTHIDAKKHHYGAIGCYLSHILCLDKAKENGYDHVLICEDDIQFTNVSVLKQQLRKIIQNVKNWDVIMLASNIIRVEKIGGLKYCARVTTGMCATGYIVKSHYYDKLLCNFHEGVIKLFKNPSMTYRYALDVYWNSLQKRDMWVIPLPLTVSQLSNYSNIENRYVNYDTLMLKNINV
jgi:GR25 family glycosyltransferase involved in LPS biosynthesis